MDILRSFYFIRHGETDWNVERRLQGSSDIPLNAKGREQAHLAAQNTADLPIEIIVSSPLSRALETAEIINTNFNVELIVDDRLAEKHYGDFEGKFLAEREEWYKKTLQENPNVKIFGNGYPAIKNAEPYDDFTYRIEEVLNNYLNKYADKNILFVAHAGVFRAIHRSLFGEKRQPKNAQPFYFNKTKQGWEVSEV
jgi:broad specificity phosphatase PhoE